MSKEPARKLAFDSSAVVDRAVVPHADVSEEPEGRGHRAHVGHQPFGVGALRRRFRLGLDFFRADDGRAERQQE